MAHIHKLIDFITDVFIVYDSKVLLIDHKKQKRWLPVGGHIELDEDPEQALLREVKEECGLKITLLNKKYAFTDKDNKSLPAPDFVDIHRVNDQHQHIGLRYIAEAKTNKVKLNTKEHNGIRWFSKEDLLDKKFNLMPSIKFYSLAAIKKVNKK